MSSRISLEFLCAELRLSPGALDSSAAAAAGAWRVSPRLIGGKRRDLRLPAAWLRKLHTGLLRRVLVRLPDSPHSFCVKGRGALAAAQLHARHGYLLHLDIKSFFPSVRREVVRAALERNGVDTVAAVRIADLCTAHDELPQGASTSVALGNLVLSRLDLRVGGLCRKQGLCYSRYVDDLAVSGGKRLERFESVIRKIVDEEGWTLSDKGGMMGPDSSHRLVGLILGASPNVEAAYIDDLRRIIALAEKRKIALSTEQLRSLRGRIRYVSYVNANVGATLMRRFDFAVGCTPG